MEVKKTKLQNNHIFHRVFTSTNTHVLCLIKQINSRKAHTPTSKRCRICQALALTKQLNQTSVWGNDCRLINTFCHFLPFSAIFAGFNRLKPASGRKHFMPAEMPTLHGNIILVTTDEVPTLFVFCILVMCDFFVAS